MLKAKFRALGMGLVMSLAGMSGAVAQTSVQQQLPDDVEQYGPFVFLPSEPSLLIYHSGVGANDMLNLKKALREHPTISTIVLQNNGGGLVHIGLVVAEEVYERGLNTYIPKDSYCASACSFVFFAGKQRIAVGRLGVHQISAPELTGEEAQFGVSDIVATLPKYGVSADVLGIMFSTPAKEMYFFKPNEIAKYGINRTDNVQMASAEPQQRVSGGSVPSHTPAGAAAVTPMAAPAQAPVQDAGAISQPVSTAPSNPYQQQGGATPPAALSDEQRAINVAALMIQAGSGTNEDAMNFTREFYADNVDYFKKKRPKSEILADKDAYFRRWPIRRFVVDQNSLKAKCQDQLCMVGGIYDYKVSSPTRGKTASGTSNFTYVLDLRDRYRIVMEDSEVISR
ncbi:hypothetical protein [Bordetella genomosp. 4]|uniref:DUF4440 domain-containing protein n=2 Tax=Bordetella genomosp. 4 TaxID=463044 RepID=A0A261UCC5_9BORD|nr:hypothetical protein [Bordetella genomosp. 4]OZI52706.1 hypothetical protein CAL21_03540 [Bordetella genomosp. 4]OZI59157.1 hypothetical protein CAL20_05910 [Bordetella genomosp. 4]